MTYGPVGIRCPDHATTGGKKPGAAPRRAAASTIRTFGTRGPIVTQTLIAINVAVFLIQLFNGAELMRLDTGWIYENGVLVDQAVNSSGQLVGVAEGDWWRLITATFLHGSLIHLGMNMLVLWLIGPPVEEYFGHARYLLLYLVSGLAGSAGALILSGGRPTVGASGAIFGLMGAALILEWRRIFVFGGQALGLVVVNLVLTIAIPGISIGGHVGGLIGGGLCALAFSSLRRSPALATLSMVAVGVGERRPRRSTGRLAADRDRGDAGVGERRLRGREPRERDAVRRARDVVEPEPVAERDRARLAAVLAADPELDARLRASPALDADPHEVADAVLVDHLERVALEDAVLEVGVRNLPSASSRENPSVVCVRSFVPNEKKSALGRSRRRAAQRAAARSSSRTGTRRSAPPPRRAR